MRCKHVWFLIIGTFFGATPLGAWADTPASKPEPSSRAAPSGRVVSHGPNNNEEVYEESKAELAEKYYEEGQALYDKGQYELACKKLKKSVDNDPQPHARFMLAECYSKTGRPATAQDLFIEIKAAAKAQNNVEGASMAHQKAVALTTDLPYIVIHLPEELQQLPGLKVRLDGRVIPSDWVNSGRNKVDFGAHTVLVTASGKEPAYKAVVIDRLKQVEDVTISQMLDEIDVTETQTKGAESTHTTWKRSTYAWVGGGMLLTGSLAFVGGAYLTYQVRERPSTFPDYENFVLTAMLSGALDLLGPVLLIHGTITCSHAFSRNPRPTTSVLLVQPVWGSGYQGFRLGGTF